MNMIKRSRIPIYERNHILHVAKVYTLTYSMISKSMLQTHMHLLVHLLLHAPAVLKPLHREDHPKDHVDI